VSVFLSHKIEVVASFGTVFGCVQYLFQMPQIILLAIEKFVQHKRFTL